MTNHHKYVLPLAPCSGKVLGKGIPRTRRAHLWSTRAHVYCEICCKTRRQLEREAAMNGRDEE